MHRIFTANFPDQPARPRATGSGAWLDWLPSSLGRLPRLAMSLATSARALALRADRALRVAASGSRPHFVLLVPSPCGHSTSHVVPRCG